MIILFLMLHFVCVLVEEKVETSCADADPPDPASVSELLVEATLLAAFSSLQAHEESWLLQAQQEADPQWSFLPLHQRLSSTRQKIHELVQAALFGW